MTKDIVSSIKNLIKVAKRYDPSQEMRDLCSGILEGIDVLEELEGELRTTGSFNFVTDEEAMEFAAKAREFNDWFFNLEEAYRAQIPNIKTVKLDWEEVKNIARMAWRAKHGKSEDRNSDD